MEKINEEERTVLIAIFRNVGRMGMAVKEISEATAIPTRRLIAIAKRFEGRKFKSGTIHYLGPMSASFSKECPGIKNPRTGICARIPSEIYITK